MLFDAQLTGGGDGGRPPTGPGSVRSVLDTAIAAGLTLLRANAFAVDVDYAVLSQAPGGGVSTNEGVLRGLDYVLDEARKRGLRLLLVLTDYFADGAGGPLQFMSLAGVGVDEGVEGLQSYQARVCVGGGACVRARMCGLRCAVQQAGT